MSPFQSVIDFWFNEIEPSAWWHKDTAFDAEIAQRFGKLHSDVAEGKYHVWRDAPLGRLAEIIVLDQFSRNIYRDQPLAFAFDQQALSLAQEAVAQQADQSLTPSQRAFLYMPYMHSESANIHELAVTLFSQEGLETSLAFELKHKAIIDRFGRYPHRNAILRRPSTAAEIEFMKQPGSSF